MYLAELKKQGQSSQGHNHHQQLDTDSSVFISQALNSYSTIPSQRDAKSRAKHGSWTTVKQTRICAIHKKNVLKKIPALNTF